MITSLQSSRFVTSMYILFQGRFPILDLRKKEKKNTLGTLKNYSDITTEQVASLLSVVSG